MKNVLDDQNAAYDALAKKILSRKAILAQILKFSVKEFADCTLEDIEKKYIEGDPTLTINTMPLDDTLDIKGRNAESKSPTEGLVTFDIIFDAILPTDGETAKFIINVESQKTTQHIHYKLMKRAVYYAARLISSQKEKEFHGDNYDKIKKIFSIWVCMDVQNYRADSIQEYKISEKVLHGNFHDDLKNYDLMTIIILNLGKNPTTHKLLDLLHLIFMELKSSAEKEKILHDDFNIELSIDMREELDKMGGLMQPLIEIAVEQAVEKAVEQATERVTKQVTKQVTERVTEQVTERVTEQVTKRVTAEVATETEKKSKLEAVRNAMESWGLTAEDAMKGLKISPKLQAELKPLI